MSSIDNLVYFEDKKKSQNIIPYKVLSEKNNKKKKGVVILGATGSVGTSTLNVIRKHEDRLNLIGVAAYSNKKSLEAIVDEFEVESSVLFERDGISELEKLAVHPDADIIVVATTGTVALRAVLLALAADKDVALANKETLVVGGHLVMAAEKMSAGRVFPLDSEHNAIFQCLEGNKKKENIKKLLLTASGGPFLNKPISEFKNITVEEALCHPNWSMGKKITIDSATMANKGLEIIEACWLFDVNPSEIEVVVHPQSIVHSMVEFADNSIIAQMSKPSMTFAIQHILMYPDREEGVHESIDFSKVLELDFRPPNEEKFPCLRLAKESLIAGGFYPAAYNAANEIAVAAFLKNEISFNGIPEIISKVLEHTNRELPSTYDDLMDAETDVLIESEKIVRKSKFKI
ncbi:MAG: 1-deoxy-D-xylulose-5-phosphate reductoisomerase [Spirochaetales bacterium]|nr:1-deoxy-D-xylulose-5-phosphate reductoisomerase [Spirochaetales bacterium]